jgi:hypothetical protein
MVIFGQKRAIFKTFAGRHVYRSSNPLFDNENWPMGKRADLLSFAEKLFRKAVCVAEEIDSILNWIGHFIFVFFKAPEDFVGVLRVND